MTRIQQQLEGKQPCTNHRRRKMGIKGRRKRKRERRREKSLVVVVYTL
jgi:hypothetical protein